MTTENLNLTLEERKQFEATWKAVAARTRRPAEAYLLAALLRGRNPLKGFSPITNTRKLANGQTAYQGLEAARQALARDPLQALKKAFPECWDTPFGQVPRKQALADELSTCLKLLKESLK